MFTLQYFQEEANNFLSIIRSDCVWKNPIKQQSIITGLMHIFYCLPDSDRMTAEPIFDFCIHEYTTRKIIHERNTRANSGNI